MCTHTHTYTHTHNTYPHTYTHTTHIHLYPHTEGKMLVYRVPIWPPPSQKRAHISCLLINDPSPCLTLLPIRLFPPWTVPMTIQVLRGTMIMLCPSNIATLAYSIQTYNNIRFSAHTHTYTHIHTHHTHVHTTHTRTHHTHTPHTHTTTATHKPPLPPHTRTQYARELYTTIVRRQR